MICWKNSHEPLTQGKQRNSGSPLPPPRPEEVDRTGQAAPHVDDKDDSSDRIPRVVVILPRHTVTEKEWEQGGNEMIFSGSFCKNYDTPRIVKESSGESSAAFLTVNDIRTKRRPLRFNTNAGILKIAKVPGSAWFDKKKYI